MKIISLISLIVFSFSALASNHVARIYKIEGDVFVYIPGQVKDEAIKHVKYLDNVYHIAPAKVGMRIENGYIVNTGTASKSKVVFLNGDQFYVAPNSQYKIDWKLKEEAKAEDPSTIYLIRGALRGLVEKKGPRSGMTIKTRTVSFAVRGTDFHVRQGSVDDTQISVLRGVIEVQIEKKNKPVEVQTGQTYVVGKNINDLSVLTKPELQTIAEESKVVSIPVAESPEVSEELKNLEVKATEVTLKDIKEYQPKLYAELQNKQLTSDALSLNTVQHLTEKAPEKKSKPVLNDTQMRDPYDKYFKPKSED